MKKFFTFLVLSFFSFSVKAQLLRDDVLAAMERANDHFLALHPEAGKPTFVGRERPSNLWTRGVYFEGLFALVEVERMAGRPEKSATYYRYIEEWGAAHRWMPRNGVGTRDADDYCCCQTYIDMYVKEGREEMLAPTRQCMDNLLAAHNEPWTAGGRVKSQGSLGDWTWIDAIQMGLPVLSKLARVSYLRGDDDAARYTEQGWQMYVTTRDVIGGGLMNKADGLWWRDADFVPPYREPNGEDCYWSRGNGWVYAALVRAMDAMLVGDGSNDLGKRRWKNIGVDAHFNDYKRDYMAMTKALMRCRRADGFWNVSLHDANHYGGVELSGTALFVYGMAWGLRHGYLPRKKYLPVVYESWQAMVRECLHGDGSLGYVQGTGKEPKDAQPVTYDRMPDFDDFGLGCFLLCATEIYKLLTI